MGEYVFHLIDYFTSRSASGKRDEIYLTKTKHALFGAYLTVPTIILSKRPRISLL